MRTKFCGNKGDEGNFDCACVTISSLLADINFVAFAILSAGSIGLCVSYPPLHWGGTLMVVVECAYSRHV